MERKFGCFFAIFQFFAGIFSGGNPDLAVTAMTFNIRYDNPADAPNDWNSRKRLVVDFVYKYKPDVVGFQEVLEHQLNYLNKNMPEYSFVGVGRDDGKTKGEYAPLFYRTAKFNLVDYGTFWLSETPDVPGSKSWADIPRIATWAVLYEYKSEKNLLCINTHFDHQSVKARNKSAIMIMEFIHKSPYKENAILMGDFNTNSGSTAYSSLTTNCGNLTTMYDAAGRSKKTNIEVENTYNGFGQPSDSGIIDFIFVSNKLKVKKLHIPDVKTGNIYISDHSPVYMEAKTRK